LSKLTPMMEQYLSIKKQHPDKIVFFQVGDFYEIFFDDAPVVAQELDIALTSRDAGKENPIPLAGVPVHAAEGYMNKLLSKGYKLVICDQVEEASQARGLVRRAVTRILTPGTITDPEMLEDSRNNYLVALQDGPGESFGLAAVDVSTGEFRITECSGEQARAVIADELFRLQPAECICTGPELYKLVHPLLGRGQKTLIEIVEPAPEPPQVKKLLVEHFGLESWNSRNLSAYPLAASAAAVALEYLQRLQSPAGKHFNSLELFFPGSYMVIDSITSRNLELTRTIRSGEKEGTLLGLLDRCVTAMGRRLIRRWVEQPLLELKKINERLTAVEEGVKQPLVRRELRSIMHNIIDLERFCSRLCYQRVSARDLVSMARSLEKLETLRDALSALGSPLYKQIREQLPLLNEPAALIRKALVDDPPLALTEGGLFKEGYHEEVDRLKTLSREGRNWLLELEKQERERTGIKSLRIGYNKNFGYYIEVTRANLPLVPVHYHRRQTLVNAERFVTAELKEMEEQITGARDRLFHLEYSLFEELRDRIANFAPANRPYSKPDL
jgi:DNA mismatch repair protein MutS